MIFVPNTRSVAEKQGSDDDDRRSICMITIQFRDRIELREGPSLQIPDASARRFAVQAFHTISLSEEHLHKSKFLSVYHGVCNCQFRYPYVFSPICSVCPFVAEVVSNHGRC